ncbi:hypothetical protein JCM8547_006074 [Rhodosporidiobolus lusitaniae]
MADQYGLTQQPLPHQHHHQDEKSPSSSDYDSKSRASALSPPPPSQAPVEPTFKSRGVVGVEAMAREAKDSSKGRKQLWAMALLIYTLSWIKSAMARSVTASFSVLATSDFAAHSSGLGTLNIATGLISSVCLPFFAKATDVFSRPSVYSVALVCQVVGYIIILKSPILAAYVVGNVLTTLGASAFTQINSTLIADLTPLKWRGMAQAIMTTPYLCTVWFTSEIVAGLSGGSKWRWGYGMYAIIFAVFWAPAIILMFLLERRALQKGLVNVDVARQGVDDTVEVPAVEVIGQDKKGFLHRLAQVFLELDTFGLILLGFGWSLLLLPFSLETNAKGGWKNPSLIAMLAVGSICLISFPLYEWKFAKFPSAPRRILINKTFVTAVIIDFCYMLSSYLQILYLSSYIYIVTDLDIKHWNYTNNVLNMGLCGAAIFVGVLFRYFHRYKLPQIVGISIRIIGFGLLVDKNGVRSLARLVMSQLLSGIGSAFSTLGSSVGSQASVAHQDVALVIALLSLWSSIGASVGDAIAAQYWGKHMPVNLREFLPASVNDTQVQEFFLSITSIRAYDYDSEIRQGAIKAYEKTMYPLWSAALGVAFVSLLAALGQSNFYLGDSQNAYDHKDTAGHVVHDDPDAKTEKKTLKQKLLRFWDL